MSYVGVEEFEDCYGELNSFDFNKDYFINFRFESMMRIKYHQLCITVIYVNYHKGNGSNWLSFCGWGQMEG